MPTAALLPLPRAVFYDANGNPLSGGFVHTYAPGGTTPKATWQDSAESIPNANPITLDSAGSCLLYGSGIYQLTVTDSLGNSIPAYTGLTVDPQFDIPPAFIEPLANIAALRALATGASPIWVNGYYTAADGGEGMFVMGAPASDNGGTIIVSGAGTYYRETGGQPLNVKMFGCKGDGITDDTTSFQNSINFTVSNNADMYVPVGTYTVQNLTLPHNTDYDTYPPPWYQDMPRLIGLPGATVKKINSSNNSYLIASERWVDNVAFASSPVWIEGLALDGNGIAAYALITVSWGSYYIRNVFRNAALSGCYEPATTRNMTPIAGGRSNSYYDRNLFTANGGYGFLVDPFNPTSTIISDYWFLNNIIYDNLPGNAAINQISGWMIKGNHTFWFDIPPTSGNWSVFLGSGAPACISGNIWEGYSTTHAGLEIGGDVTGPVIIDGDQFESGLGCVATFQTTGATPATLIRVKNCSFVGNTILQHAYSNATAELISENNSFENAGPYQFSGGGGHLGILRSINDRIGTDQKIYTGRQFSTSYSVQVIDGVLYPPSFPYQVTVVDPNVIRVTGVLAGDEVIKFIASPSASMRYRVVRTASATGAFALKVQTSGGVDIYNLGSAGTFADYIFDGTAWVQIGTGTAA